MDALQAAAAHARVVVVDMTDTIFFGASTLGLAAVCRQLRDEGGELLVAVGSAGLRLKMIKVTRLGEWLQFFPGVPEARAAASGYVHPRERAA